MKTKWRRFDKLQTSFLTKAGESWVGPKIFDFTLFFNIFRSRLNSFSQNLKFLRRFSLSRLKHWKSITESYILTHQITYNNYEFRLTILF